MQKPKKRRCEVDCETNRLKHPSTCTFLWAVDTYVHVDWTGYRTKLYWLTIHMYIRMCSL